MVMCEGYSRSIGVWEFSGSTSTLFGASESSRVCVSTIKFDYAELISDHYSGDIATSRKPGLT